MQTQTTIRRPQERGPVELSLAGSNLALLLVFAATLDAGHVGLLAAGLAGMHAFGRLAAFGLDREVAALLPRQVARRARRQLILAGQLALVRHCGALLGAAFAVAALLETTGSALPASAVISIGLGAVGTALFDYGTAPRPAGLGHPSVGVQRLAMPLSRVAITTAAVMLLPERPDLILLAHALSTLAFGLPPFLWAERRLGRLRDETLVQRLLRRARWRGIEESTGALALHAGTLVLVALGRWSEAGVFAVALALALAFRAALLPFERSLRVRVARRRLPRSMASALGLSLLVLPAVVTLGWWLPRLFPVLDGLRLSLWLLTGSVALDVVEAPLASVCRSLRLPRVLAASRVTRLVVAVGLGLVWASRAGATGVALAQVTSSAASLAVLGALGWLLARARPERSRALELRPDHGR
jgi:hypothetical protein